MTLSGSQFKTLQDALRHAFLSTTELANMVWVALEEDLDAIAGGENRAQVIFNLLRWAEAQGRVAELIHGAATANPTNPQLRSWYQEHAVSLPELEDAIDPYTTSLQTHFSIPHSSSTPFHVNFPKNSRFQGREQELERLHAMLQSNNSVGINSAQTYQSTAGVTGMGGIGKTQLAVEYAYRHQRDYPGGIFLINAAETIQPQLVNVAKLLNLTTPDPERADINDQLLTALVNHLQQHPKTLLIFDNVEDPDLLLRRTFGPGLTLTTLGGTLLITTRTRTLPSTMKAFALDTLKNDPDAARAIFTNARPDLANDDQLEALCERMGYLPLGLNFAASVLGELDDLSVADYLAELNELGLDALNAEAGLSRLQDYEYISLETVFQRQWELLQQDEQNAANASKLFQIAGQLEEAAIIPIARLGLLADLVDTSKIRRPLTRALDRLENLYFIEWLEGDAIRLHPLVRDFAKGCVSEDQRITFRDECAANMVDAYEDLQRMVDEIYERGVVEVQQDLLTALTLEDPQYWLKSASYEQLASLNTLLQREAHSLRQGTPRIHLVQQIEYRVAERGLVGLMGRAKKLLANAQDALFQYVWANRRESLALERTLIGHEHFVNAVVVFDEGSKAISASRDKTLKVWDLQTGQIEQTIRGHKDEIRAVAIIDKEKKAISADSKALKIWDLKTGQLEQILVGHEDTIRSVSVYDNGAKAISASNDRTLKIWDLLIGELIQTLDDHQSDVLCAVAFDEGRKALSASIDKTLKIWDLKSGCVIQTLTGHKSSVSNVVVFDDGRKAISASYDKSLKIWDLQTGKVLQTLFGHKASVTSVAIFDEGRKAVSASNDKTLKTWDLDTGEEEQTLFGHEKWIKYLSVYDNGNRAVSASVDQTLKIWDLKNIQYSNIWVGHEYQVNSLIIYDDGCKAVSVSVDSTIKVWNLRTGQMEMTFLAHNDNVRSIAIFDNEHRAVSTSDDKTIRIWNLHTGEMEQTFTWDTEEVQSLAVFRNGHRIIAGIVDGTIRIGNLEKDDTVRVLTGHSDWVMSLALYDEDRKAISGSKDKTIKVWNLQLGYEEQTLFGHRGWVNEVVVFDEGRKAISASNDQTLMVWNLQSGETKLTLNGHESYVNAVAVFDEGRKAISASSDRTIKVWDLTTGKEVASIMLDGSIQCVAVHESDEGVIVVAGDQGGGVYCLQYVEP
ncbi:MAG: effector-associated domain EAD1-containing protein [Chloroflexota bacterium]